MQPIGVSSPVIGFLQGGKDLNRPGKRKPLRRKVVAERDSRKKPNFLNGDSHPPRDGNRKGRNPLPARIVDHCRRHET